MHIIDVLRAPSFYYLCQGGYVLNAICLFVC